MSSPVSNAAYRSRMWWIPATVAIVIAVSIAQVAVEVAALGRKTSEGTIVDSRYLVAHAIAFVLVAGVSTVATELRRGSGKTAFLPYSERYLIGVGYGFAVSIVTSVAYGGLAAETASAAVEKAGGFLYLSVITMQLPVACIVGGIAWHLVSRVRTGSTPPVRQRRPIEDPE